MSGPNCHNCTYSICDQEAWLRSIRLGEPILPMCANHPRWPGRLHEVPGVPCKNYRRKPTIPQGDVRLIPLTDGLYAYVDAADYEWLSQWNWYASGGGYAARSDKGKAVFMHREIMKPPKGKVVDHHDGNKANNCRLNLRNCTQHENRRNIPKFRNTRSPFKGVYYHRDGKICAQLWCEGRLRWLGFFPDEISAAKVYDHAVVEAFGEFASPNFPRDWSPERRRRVHAQYLRTGELSIIRKHRRAQEAKAKKAKTKERKKATRRGESSFARKEQGSEGKDPRGTCARQKATSERQRQAASRIPHDARQTSCHREFSGHNTCNASPSSTPRQTRT